MSDDDLTTYRVEVFETVWRVYEVVTEGGEARAVELVEEGGWVLPAAGEFVDLVDDSEDDPEREVFSVTPEADEGEVLPLSRSAT
jgi:hypothetical protein